VASNNRDRSRGPESAGDARRPHRERLLSLALVVASTLITLLIAEVGIRIAYRDVSTTSDNRSWFAFRWRQANPIRRNALGFREEEIGPKGPDEYRIAVIGDSFTQGQGIAVEDRLTNLLEARLGELRGTASGAAPARRFEVLNFGRSGAASDDHLDILREHVLGVSPDFVLVQWFVNDVEALDEAPTGQYWRLVPSDRATGWLRRHSALFYFASQAWRRIQRDLGIVESYDDYVERTFADRDGEAWRRVEAGLRELVDTASARSIPTGIVFYPELRDVDGDPARYPSAFLHDHVAAFCADASLTCVDLRSTFAGVSPAKGLWASRLDSHPGRAANLLAVEAVLDAFGDVWIDSVAAPSSEAPGSADPPQEESDA